jgi:hypothetical protein
VTGPGGREPRPVKVHATHHRPWRPPTGRVHPREVAPTVTQVWAASPAGRCGGPVVEPSGMDTLPRLPPMPPTDRLRLTGLLLAALERAFGDGVVAVILKGSALKGDFVPHYSDFDLHAFVRGGLLGPRTPDLAHALGLQEALGAIDPEAFAVSQIQLYLLGAGSYPPDWIPPIPDTYAVVHGALPPDLPVPDPAAAVAAARTFLGEVRRTADAFLGRIADKPDGQLARYIRSFGTDLKPLAYHAAVLRGADPLGVWRLPLREVLPPAPALHRYFAEVWEWAAVRRDPARLRRLVATAYRAVLEVCAIIGT